jgi:hypothetical protein
MSGTRKMEKFELDAYTKAREEELTASKGSMLEEQAAAAIAELQPGAMLDALGEPGGETTDLPARAFEPRASADLPAVPFAPRAPADLPAVPFAPRVPAEAPALDAGIQESAPASANMPASVNMPASASANATESSPSHGEGVERPATPGAEWVPGEWVPPQQVEAPVQDEGRKDAAALRTQLTRKFVSLADSVTEAFREFTIGAGEYAVELTAPQGMSTGGGKRALQHLRLRPRRPGYAILVVGTVNPIERRAELRDHDHIATLNEVRFGTPIDITPQEWEQFLRKAEVVLNGADIQSLRTPPTHELLAQRRKVKRISRGALVALVVVLALAALVVWRVVVALRAGN